MEKKKYGWTVNGILGFIFIPMGLIFLPLGLLLWFHKAGRQPEDPKVFLLTFGVAGAVFLLLGLVFLALDLRRRALLRRAYEGGNYVMAKVAGLHEKPYVEINCRMPHVLECHYTDPDTGVSHVWFSRYLYHNVSGLLQAEEVPVYFDRLDSRIGFVDVDAILPKICVHK